MKSLEKYNGKVKNLISGSSKLPSSFDTEPEVQFQMFGYIAYDWSNAWWFSMWCQIQDEFAFNVSVQRPFQLMPGISLVILILENHLIFTIPVPSNFMFLNVCLLYELGSLWWIFFLFESQKIKHLHSRMSLHFQSKCDKANLQTLLGRIKLFKVNSKKKNNLK